MGRLLGRLVFAGCLLGGFGLTSYGVVRQSFADMAVPGIGFGEGAWGEGPWGGGGPSDVEEALVRAGIGVGLLPSARRLDVEDRRRNAAAAIAGVGLLAFSTLAEVWKTVQGS